MFARVELIKATYDQALTVPLYAVITQGDERFVYLEEGGQAVKRPIELGVLSGWQVQVVRRAETRRTGDRGRPSDAG